MIRREWNDERAGISRLRVAVIHDYLSIAESFADWSRVRELADLDFFSQALPDDDAVVAAVADYDIVCSLRERLPLSAALMDRLPRLRLFVASSELNRVIDFEAADERGIEIAGTLNGALGYAATAELNWGLVIAVMRGILQEDRAIRQGRFQTQAFPTMYGKTIGIIGLGVLGGYTARFAHEFGMHVLAYSPHLTELKAVESRAELVAFDDLMRRSDVVSIHMGLGETTRKLIDARALSLMKPTAVLINTSRGPLIDEPALVDALREGRIAGAGLDVYENEPLPAGHPLTQFDNVVLSPHTAGFTEEIYREWYDGIADAVVAFLEGREPLRHRRG